MDIGTPNSNDGKKIIIHYFVTESSKDIKYSPKTKDIQVLIYIMEIVPIIASAFVLAPKLRLISISLVGGYKQIVTINSSFTRLERMNYGLSFHFDKLWSVCNFKLQE